MKEQYDFRNNNKDFSLVNYLKFSKLFRVRARNDKIKIWHRNFTNWTRPVFVGKINYSDEGFQLKGYFRMLLSTRFFLSFWFGFCALWIICTTAMLLMIFEYPFIFIFPMVGIIIYYLGYLLLKWAKKRITEQIEDIVFKLDQSIKG